MKTVFLIIPSVQRINSLIHTDIFPKLQTEVKIVIFSAFPKKEIADAINNPNIYFETLKPLSIGAVQKNILRLREILLKINLPRLEKEMAIMKSVAARKPVKDSKLKSRFLRMCRTFMKPFIKAAAKCFDNLEEIIFYDQDYQNCFKKYSPQAVIVGTLGAERYDIIMMAHARKNKIKIFVTDLPWNYLDDRLFSSPRPVTKIFVWNEWWKNELEKNYGVPASQISIAGSARYDTHFFSQQLSTKSEFFEKLGLDQQKKLITFALGSEYWHPFQHEVITFILDSIKNKKINFPAQLLVRIGPKQKNIDKYYNLRQKYSDLFVEESDIKPEKKYLLNLLKSSDVILSIFSSLALDAAILDKPMIYIGFTTKENEPFNEVLKKIFKFETIKQALDTEGVTVAFDKNDFLNQLKKCLENPTLKSNERKALIKHFLGNTPEGSGKKIAEEILAYL